MQIYTLVLGCFRAEGLDNTSSQNDFESIIEGTFMLTGGHVSFKSQLIGWVIITVAATFMDSKGNTVKIQNHTE